jgi:hypothetical protein
VLCTVFMILLLVWLVGVVAFEGAGLLFHLLLLAAVLILLWRLFRGSRSP